MTLSLGGQTTFPSTLQIRPNLLLCYCYSSVTKVCLTLWLHGLQHARLPCPSPSPRVCPSSCPLSQWWHPTISSSVNPFSSYLQSFPESGCFPVSQLFSSGGQSVGASVPASVLPMNIQGWFPLGLTGLISLLSKGLWRVFCFSSAFTLSFIYLLLLSIVFVNV